jgi:hypothetical protein
LKVVCIETNDFALSGVVPMVARRVVTTRVFTRKYKKEKTKEQKNIKTPGDSGEATV